MRLLILTQDDPFFLGKNIDFLLNNIPENTEVVGTVLFDVSPFGKRESLKEKTLKTLRIFGWAFFLHYSLKFILAKINAKWSLKKVLQRHNIPVIQLTKGVNHKESLALISSYQPDLLISIGGNQIFKKPLLELAPKGCINLHTALLPKYRGLMPSFWVLRYNEKYTGVSVFMVDEGIDSGPIIVQKTVEIGSRTQQELIRDTKQLGMESIIEAIAKIKQGGFSYIPNPDDQKSYYSFPTAQDVREFKKAGKRFF